MPALLDPPKPVSLEPEVFSTARSLAWPRESGYEPESEPRASASGAGSSVLAPDVLVFAKVELEPDTP